MSAERDAARQGPVNMSGLLAAITVDDTGRITFHRANASVEEALAMLQKAMDVLTGDVVGTHHPHIETGGGPYAWTGGRTKET